MKSKFYLADKRMLSEISQIFDIINIVNYNFELLLLLKFELYVEALDPGGVKIVHNNLSHTDHLPHSTLLLI